jgi:hypothetical protein
MIEVTKQERNTLYYKCVCGSKGMYSFKPMNGNAAIVMDIKCLSCHDTERITLLQYTDENNKQEILDNIESMDLSWVPSINEELLYNGED